MKNKTKGQIFRQTFRKQLKNESILITLFLVALIYAFLSNIFLRCTPLCIDRGILNIMASVDDLFRNCCYGLIVSILFYVINDYYKNIGSKIDGYNEMFPELYEMWWSLFYSLSFETDDQYNESKGIDSNYNILYHHFKEGKKDKEFSPLNIIQIPFDKFNHLQCMWQTALENKKKFLEIYGNIINRKEYSQLAYSEYDISLAIVNSAIEDIKIFNNREHVCITERNLQRALYLIVQYELYLAKMVNKYSEFYYGERNRMAKMPETINNNES